MILDADGKAQTRRIETGQNKGADAVVNKGLVEGELVITQGIQQVRPGQAVSAAPATSAAGALEQ